jgi:hypothetical protein
VLSHGEQGALSVYEGASNITLIPDYTSPSTISVS